MSRKSRTCAPNPILREDSLGTIRRRIESMKAIDLQSATDREVETAARACMRGYTCPLFPLGKISSAVLFRAVRQGRRQIERVGDIGYPPPDRVLVHGRANQPRKPVFYAATDFDTALLEMRPKIGSRLVIGQWILSGGRSPRVRELGLLEVLSRVKPSLAKNLKSYLVPGLKQGLSDDDLEKQRLIRQFLSSDFTKEVEANSEHEYRLSAAIAGIMIGGRAEGLVYASIATTQSGVNVALKPMAVDNLYRVKSCWEVLIEKKLSEHKYKGRVMRKANRLTDDDEIVWR